MPLYKTNALILRTYALGESDRIVVFLTCDRGKKRGVARNAARSRRRFGGGLESMTCGRVEYRERENRDLVSLHYIQPTRSPLAATDEETLGHMEYFAELIDEWAPEADPNEAVYRLGVSVVEALVAGGAIDPLARYFEYWLLRLQGVYQDRPQLSPGARAFLSAVRTNGPLALATIPAPSTVLREVEAAHRALIAGHLERELRSTRVLQALRRDPGPTR